MSDDLTAEFESIGDNCEFGFVLRRLGNEASSLLRWAFLDSVAQTTTIVETGAAGVFEFENLEPAGGGTMVRDVSAGIAFHTQLRSVERDRGWMFVAPEPERRAIHADERRKFRHLAEKFQQSLADGRTIYVLKRNDGLAESEVDGLFSAIRHRGPGRLLCVHASTDPAQIGSAKLIRPGLAHGWVDRFAPYDQSDQVSAQSWESLLRSARTIL